MEKRLIGLLTAVCISSPPATAQSPNSDSGPDRISPAPCLPPRPSPVPCLPDCVGPAPCPAPGPDQPCTYPCCETPCDCRHFWLGAEFLAWWLKDGRVAPVAIMGPFP